MMTLMLNQEGISDAAAKGAELLDIQLPDWHWRVNLAELDLRNGNRCILGQLYGSYLIGLRRVGFSHIGPSRFGFTTGPKMFGYNPNAVVVVDYNIIWDALKDAWHDQIVKRRTNDQSIRVIPVAHKREEIAVTAR